MSKFINEACYDSIYSFADVVNSLYYVKQDVKHQQPSKENVSRYILAMQKSLMALAECVSLIKRQANDSADDEDDSDVKETINKIDSLIKPTIYDLMSESLGKRIPLSFHAFNRMMCGRQKRLQLLCDILQKEIDTNRVSNRLVDAYIRAIELFIAIVRDKPSPLNGLSSC